MSKSLLTATLLLAGIVFLHSYARTDKGSGPGKEHADPTYVLRGLPDSVLTVVKM